MRHATIIPLIGGEVLASTEVFGSRPDYILSYSAFKENESHILCVRNFPLTAEIVPTATLPGCDGWLGQKFLASKCHLDIS